MGFLGKLGGALKGIGKVALGAGMGALTGGPVGAIAGGASSAMGLRKGGGGGGAAPATASPASQPTFGSGAMAGGPAMSMGQGIVSRASQKRMSRGRSFSSR